MTPAGDLRDIERDAALLEAGADESGATVVLVEITSAFTRGRIREVVWCQTTDMPKPRIVMTTRRRTMPTFLSDRTDLYTLGAEYPAAITASGGLPILLPHHHAEDAVPRARGVRGPRHGRRR